MKLATAILFALAAGSASAAPVVIRDHDHLALSPKGDRMADVEASDPGNLPDDPHDQVVLRDAGGKVLSTFDPCGTCRYSDTAWAPSGAAFAFIATDRKAGKATLYVVENNTPRAAAIVSGVANDARWSPDGTRIALLVTEGARKMTGAVEAGAALVGEIGEDNDEQRIAVLPVKGGALKLVSPADTYVYEYDWAPGGFVATAAKGNGDNNWWIASLDFVSDSGTARVIAAPKMQIELPRVSPDGKTVAFIGGLMSDWQSIGGDVYTVPVAGGAPVNMTPDFKGSFRSIDWRGGALVAGAIVDDAFAIGDVDLAKRLFVHTIWMGHPRYSGPGAVETVSYMRDGLDSETVRLQGVNSSVSFDASGLRAAFIAEDFNHAARILYLDIAQLLPNLRPITHENDALAENVSAQSVHWINEGFHLQGWLVGPKKTEPGKKYPMIVIVHGGPSSAYTPHYIAAGGQHGRGFDFAYDMIEKGAFIFYPNDRGSYGQGEAFTRANVKDFGRGDLRDMLAGVDAVEKMAPVDDKRLGLYGHSYGGWFSMWADTQTHRFKAFVAGAGIANWTSYYGQNGIDQWMIPFFGASVYDDPAVYRAASPIEFIKNAKTPMLIYVGERDVECPAPQSLEYWHALKTIGTPAQLFIYAGEGHRFRKLTDLEDLRARILGWYGRYLK